jgi:predicted alpha/beta superfamily hydrolase
MSKKAKNRVAFYFLFVFAAVLFMQNDTVQAAQRNEFFIDKIKLHSQILEEERTLLVYLPTAYKNDKKEYPVFYILDAEAQKQFQNCISTIEEFHTKGISPQMIVIGIWNTNRNRDMIPEAVSHRPGSGGAEKFLKFINEELIPFVKKNYRTSDTNYLYGASNAGLFTVYALLEKPETFNGYIASSPMVGHNPNFMQAKLEAFVKKDLSGKRVLYMIYGTKDSPRVTEFVPEFQKHLEERGPEGFTSTLKILEGEGHVPQSSFSRGYLAVIANECSECGNPGITTSLRSS